MHVEQAWRYPVKSMIGESVPMVQLADTGVVGDRRWATRDLERGGIRGGKKIGGLMRCAAASAADGHATIRLPDGTTTATDAPDVHERVSAAVGQRVRLEALRPTDDREHYRRGPADTDDVMAELRQVFGREPDEPLPDLGIFPPEIMEFESPPGTYHDAFPLMVMSSAALAALADALPDSDVDVRRFRPSLVVGAAGEGPHPEAEWVGRHATVGTARVEFVAGCPRCVMVTRALDDEVGEDRRILRHIVAELGQDLGVYARVTRPGTVAVGDPVVLDA